MGSLPLVLLLLTASLLSAQEPRFAPFEMLWKIDGGTVFADLSFLLDAPAGRDGHLTIRNGRLTHPNGRRFRLWGVNFSPPISPPKPMPPSSPPTSPASASTPSVSITSTGAPRGIIDSAHPDSRHLHPDSSTASTSSSPNSKTRHLHQPQPQRRPRLPAADGVPDAPQLGFAKAVTFFDERLITLQQEFARQLLATENPYTGLAPAADPAVAIVEIVNENSLVEAWVRGRTLGQGPDPNAADRTFGDMPASCARQLDAMYQTWLAANLPPEQLAQLHKEAGNPVPRLRPAEIAAAPELRFHSEARFYIDLETRFFARMKAFLREELGVKALLVGTSAYASGLSPYPLLTSAAQLDITDAHFYWQHPSYFLDPETGKRGFRIRNTPMVNEPSKSSVITLQRAAIAGQPFIVSEVNHPYPNEFAAEALPLLAAYGAFHDWDALYWYSFEHSDPSQWIPKYPGHFDSRQDPVKMSQLALGALLFLRGDVDTAKRIIRRDYTAAQVRESLRLPSAAHAPTHPGFPNSPRPLHPRRLFNASKPSTNGPASAPL